MPSKWPNQFSSIYLQWHSQRPPRVKHARNVDYGHTTNYGIYVLPSFEEQPLDLPGFAKQCTSFEKIMKNCCKTKKV